MKKGILTLMLLWVWTMCPPAFLWGQTPLYYDEIGCGARAIAMGQAYTAVAEGPEAAYYNPAGLTQTPTHFSLTLGYQYTKPRTFIDVYDNDGNHYYPEKFLEQVDPSRVEDQSARGLWIGAAGNFEHLSLFNDPPTFMRNVAFGVVIFNTLPELNTFWNPQRKQDPYSSRYSKGFCLLNIAISAAYRVNDYISVGAGIMPRMDTWQETLDSYVDAEMAINYVLTGETPPFHLRFKTKVRVYASYLLGILIRPPIDSLEDKVSIGVCYRRQLNGYYGTGMSSQDVVSVANVSGETSPGLGPPGSKLLIAPLRARSVDFIGWTPAQVTMGVAVRPVDGLLLSGDITWKDYSKYLFFWALPPEPKFNDVWVPRFGLEYGFNPGFKKKYVKKIDKIRLMGGYYFEPSPVPDMNGEMNIIDSDQNVFSMGVGLDYRMKGVDLLKIETYFQFHQQEINVLHNRQDPLFGVIRSGGEVYSAGISVTFQL